MQQCNLNRRVYLLVVRLPTGRAKFSTSPFFVASLRTLSWQPVASHTHDGMLTPTCWIPLCWCLLDKLQLRNSSQILVSSGVQFAYGIRFQMYSCSRPCAQKRFLVHATKEAHLLKIKLCLEAGHGEHLVTSVMHNTVSNLRKICTSRKWRRIQSLAVL